jgi:hypothetical protein
MGNGVFRRTCACLLNIPKPSPWNTAAFPLSFPIQEMQHLRLVLLNFPYLVHSASFFPLSWTGESACSLATFACVFFLGPALFSGGLASIGPADGEAATQEFSIGAGRGKA